MVPEMSSSSFLRSARAARGRPQFATYNKVCWEGNDGIEWMNILVPKNVYLLDDACEKANKYNKYICSLKKYSRAAGERSQVKKVEDMV
jgi:hypothetical protein